MCIRDSNKPEHKWSYVEILYLFGLCRRYDLSWFVIYDRYNFGEEKSLEDLKEMFYEVCRKYFLAKDPNDTTLSLLDYKKDKEVERKKYLKRLLSRSAAEIAEEEALIIESKKFEMAAKKTLSERESIPVSYTHLDVYKRQVVTNSRLTLST